MTSREIAMDAALYEIEHIDDIELRERLSLVARAVAASLSYGRRAFINTMDRFICGDEVFEHAYASTPLESRELFIHAAVYQVLTAPLPFQETERKARLTRLLVQHYPEQANESTVALWLDEVAAMNPLKAGPVVWAYLMRKPDDAIPLPAGFEQS